MAARRARRAEVAPGPAPLALLVDALATYRLTRLATADVISEPWRRSIVERTLAPQDRDGVDEEDSAVEVVDDLDDPSKLARLVTCRWCAGVWIAAGVVAARRLAPRAWEPVAQGLALSAAAVLLARAEDG